MPADVAAGSTGVLAGLAATSSRRTARPPVRPGCPSPAPARRARPSWLAAARRRRGRRRRRPGRTCRRRTGDDAGGATLGADAPESAALESDAGADNERRRGRASDLLVLDSERRRPARSAGRRVRSTLRRRQSLAERSHGDRPTPRPGAGLTRRPPPRAPVVRRPARPASGAAGDAGAVAGAPSARRRLADAVGPLPLRRHRADPVHDRPRSAERVACAGRSLAGNSAHLRSVATDAARTRPRHPSTARRVALHVRQTSATSSSSAPARPATPPRCTPPARASSRWSSRAR